MKLFRKNNHVLKITLSRMDGCNILIFPSAGIKDEDFPWLYYDIIERLFERSPMMISQFVDISQHYKDIKQHDNEFSDLYNIDLKISRSFVDLEKINSEAEIYYLHIRGLMNSSWLHHLIGFGGASLSTIFWNNHQASDFCDLLEWNTTLISWLFEETEKIIILRDLIGYHSTFCIIVDGRLWILFPQGNLTLKLINLSKLVFNIYDYSTEINIKDW